MDCNCPTPQPRPYNGHTPPVINLCQGERPVIFHSEFIPASFGDDTTGTRTPFNGAYYNMLVEYEANGAVYLYNSDGIYMKISSGISEIAVVDELPPIEKAVRKTLYIRKNDGLAVTTVDNINWIEATPSFDTGLSTTSKRAVQNKVIAENINRIDRRIDDILPIGDGEVTFKQNNVIVGKIRMNQVGDATINLTDTAKDSKITLQDSAGKEIGNFTLDQATDKTITFPLAGSTNLGLTIVDNALSVSSSNPVSNYVVANALNTKLAKANYNGTAQDLDDRITNIERRGRYLSTWNATTGKPDTNPTSLPYSYRSGDYYIVSHVGGTNYRPVGANYTGAASTTRETAEVQVNDTYLYDGTNWSIINTTQDTIATNTIAGIVKGSTADGEISIKNAQGEMIVNGWDDKLDKVATTNTYDQVYAKTTAGEQGMYSMGTAVASGLVVKRDGSGRILVNQNTSLDNEATSKKYVDTGDTTASGKTLQQYTTANVETALLVKGNNTTSDFTGLTYFNTQIHANPSTGNLTAPSFTEGDKKLEDKYEQLSNKVTNIDDTATNSQYPSAKGVYDSQEMQNSIIRDIEGLLPKSTKTGEEVIITDSADCRLYSLVYNGNSNQDTTTPPSPEYPQEIHSAGRLGDDGKYYLDLHLSSDGHDNVVAVNIGDKPLMKIESVYDKITVDMITGKITRQDYIGTGTIDGSGSWAYFHITNGELFRRTNYPVRIKQSLHSPTMLSDRYLGSSYDGRTNNTVYCLSETTAGSSIDFIDNRFTDAASFKNAISTEKPIIYFQYYDEQTPYTVGTLSAEELAKIRTYTGDNNITTKNSNPKPTIEVTYFRDLNSLFNEQVGMFGLTNRTEGDAGDEEEIELTDEYNGYAEELEGETVDDTTLEPEGTQNGSDEVVDGNDDTIHEA